MRRALILGSDLAVSGLLVLWFEWGVWLDLYGFTSRHPKSALDYFQGFVGAGSMLFASLFAVFSVILLFAFYGDERSDSRRPLRAFYGDGSALVGKYAALVLSVVISPGFYFIMWQQDVSRSTRMAGGFLMESLLFLFGVLVAEWFIAVRGMTQTIEPAYQISTTLDT